MQEKDCTGRVSEKIWALKVNEMLFMWMDHIISQNNPLLTLWRGTYESFPLLWLSIQGPTLFTYLVYSVDRFSEPPNSSRCAYESGVSSCISINSGWAGKCFIFTMFLYWSVVAGLAHSAFLYGKLSRVKSWYLLCKYIQFSMHFTGVGASQLKKNKYEW